MTIQQKKEQLSNRFVGALAAYRGFVIDKPELDNGVDYQAKKSYVRTINGVNRIAPDSRYIDIQLKATTEDSIIEGEDDIRYDLEAKSYNDLVDRQRDGLVPLILILFVLPSEQDEWVSVDESELKLKKHAFWYTLPENSDYTENIARIRITIPKANMLGIDCFEKIHRILYGD